MKRKYFAILPILGLLLFVGASLPNYFEGDDPEKEKLILQTMIEGLRQVHFSPQKVDDNLSERTYTLYMKRLDGGKRFLTKSDVKKLEKYKDMLDDEAIEGSYQFLNLSIELFDKRKKEVQEYYRAILAEPFDFDKDEMIESDADKLDYPKNGKAVKELWRKSLKYQVMTRLASALEEQSKEEEGEKKSMKELEAEARKKVLKTHDDWFKRMDRLERRDRLDVYINCVANAYDPHTSYYPPQDKENFDISMSGRLEGIGARLQETDRYVKVVSIVPGSPSYKQGDLEVGDKIQAVAQGDAEPVDATNMRIDDVVKMIRGKKGTEVRLTVLKRDNSKLVIPIIRDIIELEESYAKSAILKGESEQRIGYIHLPKFYTDFQRNGGRRCATDVKDELTKLMDDKVDGVILDLRNNGGGSLGDVVEMGGLFIDEGPIVQVKSRNRAARILKDRDPEVHYDGPLVIMVNSFSASASEILAAAMQDYGRAIIVGSSPTFGKGTVQQFIDLDRLLNSDANQFKPLGAVKLTTQKFYRVDGRTTQLKGVTPDIIIPDDYSYLEIGEEEEDYAMGWDEIPAAKYAPTNSLVTLDKIQSSSSSRVQGNPAFVAVDKSAKKFKERRERSVFPLNLKKYQAEQDALQAEEDELDELKDKSTELTIATPKADMKSIEESESKQARIKEWHKDLKKDLQLKETIAIMQDMIQ